MDIYFPVEDTHSVLIYIIVIVCFPARIIMDDEVLISFEWDLDTKPLLYRSVISGLRSLPYKPGLRS